MPPQQIESDITDSDERFFTLGSHIDHIESRSMSGVSLIKIYFQPGTDPTAAVSGISNLAIANLSRRSPQASLPPPPAPDSSPSLNADAQAQRPDLQALRLNAQAYCQSPTSQLAEDYRHSTKHVLADKTPCGVSQPFNWSGECN